MEYDVQEHEVTALNLSHDLSSLDLAALTIIATRPAVHHVPLSSSPSKQSFPTEASSQTSKKCQ